MKYGFSELVDLDELQVLCEEFTQLTGFVTAILDMDGNVLVATGWQEVCTRFHRAAPGTALRCRKSDTVLADRLREGEEYSVYRCGNGLIDVAVPIVIDDEQVGRLYSGQFLFEPPNMEFFRRQAAEHGFEESSYLDAVRKVPVVTEKQVRLVMGFLCRLAEMIGRMGLTTRRVDDAVLIVKDSPAVLFRWKATEGWPIEYVSENVVQFGHTPEELMSGNVPYLKLVHPEDLERIAREIAECSSRGFERCQLEYRLVTGDGEARWVDERAFVVRDSSGMITHYRGVLLDITERKHAEDALKASEQRYRDIVENAPVGIFRSTLEGKFLSANPALARILKYDSAEDLIQAINRKSVAEVCYLEPGQRARVVRNSLHSKEWTIREEPFRCKDGSVVIFNFYHRVVPGAECDSIQFEGFCEDITERKQAEEALRLTQYCVDNASIGICQISSGRILHANEQMCRNLGYSREEITFLGIQDIDALLTPDQIIQRIRQTHAEGRSNFETLHRRKDGTVFPVEVSSTRLLYAGQEIIVSFCKDITERKHAEQALRQSEEKFRLLAETSPGAIMLCQEERVLYANPAAARLSGYTVEEMKRMSFWDHVHDDFREMVRDRGLARQRGEPVPSQYECRFVTKSGEDRWALISGAPMEYGDMPTSIVVFIDITDAKRAEEALRESEERLRLALAAAKQAFYDIDVTSSTAHLSPEFPMMMGYGVEEYIPTLDFLRELIHPDDRARVFEAYHSAVMGVCSGFAEEYRHRTKTGDWKWVLSQGKALERDADGKALRMLGTVTDISERKKVEEQIRASLAEKTVLLKEVHHRVKNNLQIICSLLDLQADSIPDEQSRICFQYSQDRIRSMALVHEYLYQSRDFASIDFADYIENLATYLFNSYVREPGRILLRVEADSVLLGIDASIPCGMIINELVSNSLKHAFPGERKGDIAIGLSSGTDGLITLTVADTGVGFPPGIDMTNARTLGLQIVSMLVKQLKGEFELRNDNGACCTVRFRKGD